MAGNSSARKRFWRSRVSRHAVRANFAQSTLEAGFIPRCAMESTCVKTSRLIAANSPITAFFSACARSVMSRVFHTVRSRPVVFM